MRHPCAGKHIEAIGRQMQGLAHHECGLCERVGGAVSEHKLRRPELRHCMAHMVEDRRKFVRTRYAQRLGAGAARFGHGMFSWDSGCWLGIPASRDRGLIHALNTPFSVKHIQFVGTPVYGKH